MAYSEKRSLAMKRRWENKDYRLSRVKMMKENNPMKSLDNRKKVSLSRRGILRPDISERYKGKGNPNYKNGIRTGKREILEMNNSCKKCGGLSDLHIHHINGNRGDNSLKNLVLLCRSCHSKEHRGKEWHKMIFAKRRS